MALDERQAATLDELLRARRVVQLVQLRLVVEQVQLRRRTGHVQIDDIFDFALAWGMRADSGAGAAALAPAPPINEPSASEPSQVGSASKSDAAW